MFYGRRHVDFNWGKDTDITIFSISRNCIAVVDEIIYTARQGIHNFILSMPGRLSLSPGHWQPRIGLVIPGYVICRTAIFGYIWMFKLPEQVNIERDPTGTLSDMETVAHLFYRLWTDRAWVFSWHFAAQTIKLLSGILLGKSVCSRHRKLRLSRFRKKVRK